MSDRKRVGGAAAWVALAAAGFAYGGEGAATQTSPDIGQRNAGRFMSLYDRPLLFDDPAPESEAPTSPRPLMTLLGLTPVGKGLDAARIDIYGYVEGGYTYAFNPPPGNFIAGNLYNPNHSRVKLDQAAINIERTVDAQAVAKSGTFDIGGHVEFHYGYDTRFYHSNGLFSYYTDSRSGNFRSHPEMQMDLLQAYVDVALPVGNGFTVRAGKFVTPLGYEAIDGPGNPLYSHGYLGSYAVPSTQTGVLGTLVLNSRWSVMAGFTRGWDQSVNDNNGAADFIGSVTYKSDDEKDTLIATVSEGPQQAKNNHDSWTVIDVIYTHTFDEKFSVTVNADYGDAPHALYAKSAQWGGVAAYGKYILNDYVTLNARAEWYDDYNGFTLGATPYLSIYGLTLGATITPMPHNDILKYFQVRPELRGDYASGRAFNGGRDYTQFQFAVDAYFNF